MVNPKNFDYSLPPNLIANSSVSPRPHRYFFKLFVLDTTLNLDSSAQVSYLYSAIQNHTITKTELMGKYTR